MRHRRLALGLSVLVLMSTSPQSDAIDYIWSNAGGGNWNVAANWSPAGIPNTAAGTATIALGGTYSVTLSDTRTVSSLAVNSAAVTFTQTGTLTVGSSLSVSNGTYNLNGGTLTVNGSMTTGAGGTVNWAGSTIAGNGTLAGTINVTNGGGISGSALTNTGTINGQTGSLGGTSTGAALTNAAAGLIDFQADGTAYLRLARPRPAVLEGRDPVRRSQTWAAPAERTATAAAAADRVTTGYLGTVPRQACRLPGTSGSDRLSPNLHAAGGFVPSPW